MLRNTYMADLVLFFVFFWFGIIGLRGLQG